MADDGAHRVKLMGLDTTLTPAKVVLVIHIIYTLSTYYHHTIYTLQLGQLRLNPPGLGSMCGKRVERLSDF